MRRLLIFALCAVPTLTFAQGQFEKGTVLELRGNTVLLQLKDETITVENQFGLTVETGDSVIVQVAKRADGETAYLIQEQYRLPSLLLLLLLFFIMGIIFGGRIGFTSILGLGVSIGVLLIYVIPSIIAGANPLLVSLVGSALIACTALYLAHGFNRRTTLALVSTVITLVLSIVLAVVFVHLGKLLGMGSEEARFIQTGLTHAIDLRGLLLGGIIIGALGVLDDITTAQTAAIDELSKANHKLSFTELFAAGTSIGREHIASLINTLALAYIGASLPMFVLFFLNDETPWWVILNSEFVAEEVVRTLVGSATLLLAVPISTYIAAKAFANGNHTNVKSCGHVH